MGFDRVTARAPISLHSEKVTVNTPYKSQNRQTTDTTYTNTRAGVMDDSKRRKNV